MLLEICCKDRVNWFKTVDAACNNHSSNEHVVIWKLVLMLFSRSAGCGIIVMIMDFQDSLDDEDNTRRSQEYLNDFEEEYQERALLAKSKRFFKKGSQRFNSAKKPEPRPNKDFEEKYNKVKAKLALLSFGTSYKSSMAKNKGLVAKAYEWDEEDVSSNDNEMIEVKILMALADDENVVCISEQILSQKKRIMRLDQLTKDPYSAERPWLSKAEGFTLPNHDTATKYDSVDESIVYSILLPPMEKLAGVTINEPTSTPSNGNKNVSASKRNSAPTSKLKNVKIKDEIPLSIKFERTGHRTCDHAEYMSTMNMTQHLKSQGGSFSRSKTSRPSKPFPLCIHCGFNDHLSDDCVNYPICDICGSYDHDTHSYNRVISLRRGIKPRNPQHVIKSYETCGSTVHTKNDHNDIEWVGRGEALHAKKAKAFQSHKTESSNANRSKTPTKWLFLRQN
ncbi:hypothetical protein Tco_0615448 [Tanacetum coccineum]